MNLFITLYLINFLRTLAIIAIIYFGFRIVVRYVLPFLVDKGLKNMQQKMQDQQRRNQPPRRPEGDVTIEGRPSQKKNNEDKGEYIDFEEVD